MRSETHPFFYWFIPGCSLAGAVLLILFAVSLVVQIAGGHGSAAGNLFRIAMAIISLFLGLFLAAVGAIYRMSFDDAR